MTNKYEQKVEVIQLLINELGKEFEDLHRNHGVHYKIDIQSRDKDRDYLIGAEESSDWNSSWC